MNVIALLVDWLIGLAVLICLFVAVARLGKVVKLLRSINDTLARSQYDAHKDRYETMAPNGHQELDPSNL